jgi:hypothetical protein
MLDLSRPGVEVRRVDWKVTAGPDWGCDERWVRADIAAAHRHRSHCILGGVYRRLLNRSGHITVPTSVQHTVPSILIPQELTKFRKWRVGS